MNRIIKTAAIAVFAAIGVIGAGRPGTPTPGRASRST